MLIGDFLLSCVPTEDTEFRSYLETRSPQGERIVDHMAKTGISLEHERQAYEKIKELQARHARTNLPAEVSTKRPWESPFARKL